MTKMDFEDKTLERLYRSFKWARNNSLQILDLVQDPRVLSYRPTASGQHAVLYQFQCLATTTDRYYRLLINHADQRFGVLIDEDEVLQKETIPADRLKHILKEQIRTLENVLRHFSAEDFETHVQTVQAILNHEYLHQGQLVVMFRDLGVALPERFRQAFDL